MARAVLGLLATAAWLVATEGEAQIPERFTNLKVLPQNISRDSLVQIMRGISLSLNVRCQYCHVGGDGVSFAGVTFDKDDDPDKLKARFMLRMVDSLNRFVLPSLNLEFFPRSASILIALGTLLEQPDRIRAIQYLERAVALQPADSVLQRRLQRMKADSGGAGRTPPQG
jgi:hypothetical protein